MIKLKRIFLIIYLCSIALLNLPAALRNYIGYFGMQKPIRPNWVNVYFADVNSDEKYVSYVQHPPQFDENRKGVNNDNKDKTLDRKIAVEVWIRTWYQDQPMQKLGRLNLYLTAGFVTALLTIKAFERKSGKNSEQKTEG